MFDSTLNPLWQRYILAVQEEVKPALGCTEPISLALAAAVLLRQNWKVRLNV